MKTIFVVLFALATQTVFAWGPQGHMVVAQVAQNNLSPRAQSIVDTILKGQSLADVSNWADFVKGQREWTHTKGWHFVDIPDGQTYDTAEHAHDGDVVTAVTEMIKILKGSRSSRVDKESALKFLVHFVGDMHQPLHVGRPEDRGGNDIRVVFEGRSTNLHSLWDSQLIMKSPLNHVQYAEALERTRRTRSAPYDLPEIIFSQIITECMAARSSIYDFPGSNRSSVILGADYYRKNLNLMNAQLLAGGKRLANILNSVLR